jgi:hypothetical protein
MPHMVIFRSAEGKPGYHQAESLDEAVRFVEHLRNQEQVNETRIFRMEEVPIEFKTYYKVEVGGAAPAGEDAAPAVAEEAPKRVSPAADDPVVVEPMPAAAGSSGANNRFNRFNRAQ